MVNTRVFRRSMRHTFRSKRRFLVFLMIIAIVSTMIAFYIDSLDRLNTVDLLNQKGIKMQRTAGVNITKTQGDALYDDILAFDKSTDATQIDKSAIFYYADIGNIRINSIDINNPWLSNFANPSHVLEGSYPNHQDEVLVPDKATQFQQVAPGYNMITDLAVGQKIALSDGNDEVNLKVSGKFDMRDHELSNVDNQLWLFMDSSKFNELVTFFNIDDSQIYTYMITLTVKGLLLLPSTHDKVQTLGTEINNLINDDATYGSWESLPTTLPSDAARRDSTRTVINLGFVALGGILLSVLFAYLIVRFRRREVAILKAMGYSRGSVRSALIGELITTSFTGFIVGLLAAQILLISLSDFDFKTLIRLPAIGVAFLIMVIVALPGMALASRRVLFISPAEAFRDK